jgi:signal transduction histidine kinase
LPKPLDAARLRAEFDRLLAARDAPDGARVQIAQTPDFGARTVRQHQMALRWLSRAGGRAADFDEHARLLVDCCTDAFDVVHCALLLEQKDGVRVAASTGIPESVVNAVRLDFATGIMRWFDEHNCVIDRAMAGNVPEVLKEMQILSAHLAVPVFRSGRVCGALLLGGKTSAPAYTEEERELLLLIGRCASMAFESAGARLESLRRQQRLDTILAHITAGVVTVAPNKTVSMMNQAAERLLHCRAVDVLGRGVHHLNVPLADIVLRTLADGMPRLLQEIRDPALDGPLRVSVTGMGEDGAAAVVWPGQEPVDTAGRLEESPYWEQLSSRLAQEVKNPMVAVNTFAQLLPKKYDSAEFRDHFSRVVQEEVGRINRVVEQLTEFSQPPRLSLEPSDLNHVVRGVLDSFAPELARLGIVMETDYAPGPVMAELDGIYFAQALHHVVRNAIEAMPGGGVLRVQTRRQAGSAEVEVADSGNGLGSDAAERAFLPFFSTKERGMGLGLTAARRIAHGHGGGLCLVPGVGRGCCFMFQVPTAGIRHANHTGH